MIKTLIYNRANEVKKDFPKSFLLLKKTLNNEQLPEMVSFDDQLVTTFLAYSPRVLYDFFDENGVIINISKLPGVDQGGWIYHVEGDSHSQSAESRQEAEEKAFDIAFKKLEEKL